MKLKKINIYKFRSIENCNINIKELNAIVGENNSGKTSILRAINSVFNFEYEKAYFDDATHQYASRSNTKIILTFKDIPNKVEYQDKKCNDELILIFTYNYKNKKKSLSIHTNVGDITIDNAFLKILKQDVDYVYIPANRSSKDVTWTNNSIFQRLILSYSQQYTEKRDNVSKTVLQATNNLHKTILSKLENELTSLMLLGDCDSYKLDFEKNIDYSILFNKLLLKISDSGNEFDITECGSGIKSLSVIALHRALAKMQNANIILGIEEPETNLHPQAQKKLVSSLKDNRQSHEIQTVFSTHSPVLIDALGHEDIILVRRIFDARRGFKTKVSQLCNDFWNKYDINEFQHYQFFHYRNSDFFFAKYVILAESKTDAQVIDFLINPKLNNKITDITILNLESVNNIKYPYFLLKELEIPFSIVVDKDFFVPYKNNNELEKSRNEATGFPIYSEYLKTDNDILNNVFNRESDKIMLKDSINRGYRSFFDCIKSHRIYSMHWCLEMDLVSSTRAAERYYNILYLSNDKRNKKTLLTECYKSIKSIKNILSVLDNLPKTSYPESYVKIRDALIADINSCI